MPKLRELTSELLVVHPTSGTRMVAVRAATAVLVPLLILLALDRLSWGLYATFAAFTSIYGGPIAYAGRWRRQLAGGLTQIAATWTGALVALSDQRAWIAIPVTAVWASIASGLSDRYRWIPPGPIFAVFAVGACSARPSDLTDVAAAALIAPLTMLFALGLGLLDERRAGIARDSGHGRHRLPLNADRLRMHLVRVAVASAIAGALATALGIGHPYWAMVGAVVPLSVPRLRSQFTRGIQRLIGTLLGVGLAWVILSLPQSLVAMVVVAALLQAAAEMTVTRNYGLAMVFITPLALLMGHLAHPESVAPLVRDRFVESVLGVLVGLTVAWLTRERPRVAATS